MTSLQNLFVAKLPRNLTDSDLEQIFVDYNPSSAKVMLDATTGKSKGFGFVLFESEEAGRKAYEKLNKTHVTLHGHNFNLCIFPSKHDGKVATEESNALYVRNIPLKLSQLEVEQFLRGFGPLTYCAMREDHFGGSVWVVYAEFDTVESAKSALTSLHGNRTYFNNSVAILAKYADSEEAKRERRRRREQQQSEQQQQQHEEIAAHGVSGVAPPPPPPGHGRSVSSVSSSNSPRVRNGMGSGMPHSFSASEMHMEGSGPSLHPPAFASISHHFAPGRPGGVLPPPAMTQSNVVPMPPPPMQMSQLSQVPPPPFQQQQPPTPNSVGSFLNVTFNPGNVNTLGSNSFPHYGVEQTPSRGSPGTPLNFSFSHDGDSSCGGGVPDAGGHSPRTPVRANSNLSICSGYRHNPYAPVTPMSSGRNSTGSSTPVVAAIQHPVSPNTNMHFSAAHNLQSLPTTNFPTQQGPGFVNSHFASGGNNSFLAAPGGPSDAM
jgi:RNA recognition motif-containing protein